MISHYLCFGMVHSHGRLDKTPGAIALRLRWYGPGDPKLVFVERKTHNDKWTGEVSVKERFTVDASEVPLLLTGKYPIAQKKKEMQDKGGTPKEVEEWETLVRECQQVIVSKQLVRNIVGGSMQMRMTGWTNHPGAHGHWLFVFRCLYDRCPPCVHSACAPPFKFRLMPLYESLSIPTCV